MKKVTDLKENEGILCHTEEEANKILELLPPRFPKRLFFKGIVYLPFNMSWVDIRNKKKELESKYKIYPASDFLTPTETTYTVTREQLRNIANDNPIYFTECMAFANKRFHLLDEISSFSNDLVSTMFNEKWYDNELLKILFPNYEKPKQKKEITVWVNVYDDVEFVYNTKEEADKYSHADCKTIKTKLTYEI